MQKSKRPKVVIDTNLLVSAAIVSDSLPDELLKAWSEGLFVLFTSKEQLEEINELSSRKKFKAYPLFTKRIGELLENIAFAAEMVKPLEIVPTHSRDPKDDFLLASALGADADYLITGDDDLIVLNGDSKLGKLKILSIAKFRSLIDSNEKN